MDAIIKAFVDAGYFRARIFTLSEFDKIIGGMAWAMLVFSQDININIFYADTLDLGQKIALTERLVMVLLVMNCPHQIEPHQIVGLDYVKLLPVIRWLIKRSAEVRREHEAFNRLLALRYFFKVTNSSLDRSQWCHVIPIEQLKRFEKIEQDFESNQRVSFVDLPILYKAQQQQKQQKQQSIQEVARAVESEEESSETSAIKDISEKSPEEIASHKELDTELLATNQKILNLLRKLDSMPSQLEISQYQRRYIELHQQLICKNKDLKKLYALFNSLDSIKHYLTKEINLLESIMSNLDLTTDSAANRFEFLRQFEDIISKIQTVRDDVMTRLNTLRDRCDALNAEYVSLSIE